MKLITIVLTLSLFSNVILANTLTGRVISIADGDTITVLDDENMPHKIRLAGIDAPEKRQAFGNVSKKALSDLVFEKQIKVEWNKQDRYGRTVGKVIVNGIDVNLEQIKRGMAWFYRKYQNELILDDRLAYLHAEAAAGENKIGLWVDSKPDAPWDFRKKRKEN